jgi:hypothetical protein
MLLLPRALSQFRLAALGLVLLTVVTRLPSLLHPWSIDDEAVYSVSCIGAAVKIRINGRATPNVSGDAKLFLSY